jgi:hypothetical protein
VSLYPGPNHVSTVEMVFAFNRNGRVHVQAYASGAFAAVAHGRFGKWTPRRRNVTIHSTKWKGLDASLRPRSHRSSGSTRQRRLPVLSMSTVYCTTNSPYATSQACRDGLGRPRRAAHDAAQQGTHDKCFLSLHFETTLMARSVGERGLLTFSIPTPRTAGFHFNISCRKNKVSTKCSLSH